MKTEALKNKEKKKKIEKFDNQEKFRKNWKNKSRKWKEKKKQN